MYFKDELALAIVFFNKMLNLELKSVNSIAYNTINNNRISLRTIGFPDIFYANKSNTSNSRILLSWYKIDWSVNFQISLDIISRIKKNCFIK